jgi:hypothetical protein
VTAEELNARSIAIRSLLEDPNIQDAFAAIENDLLAEWRRAQTTEERENMWRAVNVMERLKTWLDSNASHDLTALRRAR